MIVDNLEASRNVIMKSRNCFGRRKEEVYLRGDRRQPTEGAKSYS